MGHRSMERKWSRYDQEQREWEVKCHELREKRDLYKVELDSAKVHEAEITGEKARLELEVKIL
jgi:hypothetical protein